MNEPMVGPQSREQLLDEVLFAYLRAAEGGRAPDRREWLARYPELAAELRAFFADQDRFDIMAAPLRRVAGVAPPGGGPAGEPLAAAAEVDPAAAAGGIFGDFRLLREVGRGGMGVVYEAEQISLRRRVALKVLPFAAALDARQLQRFKNESLAAAQLHHTNIVPVFYVGCDHGVHYYAMQFVEGRSLAAVIAGRRELAAPAGKQAQPSARPSSAGTVDRAEGQAIVAARAETVPAAGGAAATRSADAKWFRTVAELGVQAAEALDHAHQQGVVHRDVKPANLMVDDRGQLWVTDFGLAQVQTDVRVTLTGDLVGTLRYMSPEQALAQRVVVDHRTDVYSLGATLYELLTLQPAFAGTDRQELLRQIAFEEPQPPRRLNRAIPPELETIVLKALEKNPAERYATAQELADDLRRLLQHEPIRARRPTLRQRAQKWARRHQAVVVSAVVLLAMAVVALSVGSLLLWQEKRKTETERDRADANFQLARKAVGETVTAVAEEPRLKEADFHDLRRRLLSSAVPFYEEFARQRSDDPKLEEAKGAAYGRLAMLRAELGENEAARADYEQARALFARLAEAYPGKPEYLKDLALTHKLLGNVLGRLGKTAEAEAEFRSALAILPRLTADFPDEPDYQAECASTHISLATVLESTGRLPEAEDEAKQALAITEKLVGEFPKYPHYRFNLTIDQGKLSGLLQARGRPVEAVTMLRRSLETAEKLAADFPRVPDYRYHLAEVHRSLAVHLWDLYHQLPEVQEETQKAQALLQTLMQDFPRVPRYRAALSGTYNNLGIFFREARRFSDAEQALQQAVDISTRLVEDFPEVPAYHEILASSYLSSAELPAQGGKISERVQAARKAIAIFEQLEKKYPALQESRVSLAGSCYNLSGGLLRRGRLAEAEELCRKAARLWKQLADEMPTVPGHRQMLANSQGRLGQVLAKQKRLPEAVEEYRQALAMNEKLAADFPGINVSFEICINCTNLAELLADAPDMRLRDPAQAVELAKKAAQLVPNRFEPWGNLGLALYRNGEWKGAIEALQKSNQIKEHGDQFFLLAMAHWQLGDKEKASQYFHQAVTWMDKNDPKDEDLRRHRAEAAALLGVKEPPTQGKD
jgi:serine/threonine protein kinase/tetratricopeptide (TPR) repeat protein